MTVYIFHESEKFVTAWHYLPKEYFKLVLIISCVILISINSEVPRGEGKRNYNIFSHSLTQFPRHPTHTHFLFPLQILRTFPYIISSLVRWMLSIAVMLNFWKLYKSIGNTTSKLFSTLVIKLYQDVHILLSKVVFSKFPGMFIGVFCTKLFDHIILEHIWLNPVIWPSWIW